MAFHRIFICGFLMLLIAGCTTSKWTVVDEQAINRAENPKIVSHTESLFAEEMPTLERPVLKLVPYGINTLEYAERIKIQRTVQEYRPKWGFSLLSVAGSALAFTAANSDLLLSGTSTTQRIAFNTTGVLLGTLAVTNLRESGEPILTDEIRYLRQTGIDTRADTVRVHQQIDQTASVSVLYDGREVFNESSIELTNNAVEINLGVLASEFSESISYQSNFLVNTEFKGNESQISVPVSTFMEQRFVVDQTVAQLRSSPTISQENIVTEIAEGSSLKQVEDVNDQWVKVEYGSVEAFMQKSMGSSQLRSTAESGPALLVELTDIPYGEVDVENSLPILKPRNSDDRAIIISGNRDNQAGIRQFSERDERMIKQYMRTSLRMAEHQIVEIDDPDLSSWLPDLSFCRKLNGGTTIVYLTGYAKNMLQDGGRMFSMYHIDETGEEHTIPLREIFQELSRCSSDKLFLFVDLEYIDQVVDGRVVSLTTVNGGKQQELANLFLGDFPNAFVLFGNRVGQSSSIYSGGVADDKRHHVFPYFLAEALKQRKTLMSDLYRHLENNVDYTARRLHDRPQEIQGFGNFMLDIVQ